MAPLPLPSITAAMQGSTSSEIAGHSGRTGAEKRPAVDCSIDRVPKRRSSKACLSCRSRKVRCDVIMGGQPCTNCRLDGLHCIIKEPNRGRRPSGGPSITSRSVTTTASLTASSSATSDLTTTSTQTTATQNEIRTPEAVASSGTAISSSGAAVIIIGRENTIPGSSSPLRISPAPVQRQRADSERSVPDDFFVSLSFEDQPLPLNSTPEHAADENRLYSQEPKIQHGRSSREGDTTMAATTSPEIVIPMSASRSIHDTPPASSASRRLPPYIRPLSSQIDSRDMDYLADKGALTILNDEFRDELLRIYVNFVYPFMPAIDVKSFIESIMQGDGSRPVSLLLFQAIMFASVAFVDARFLKENGFHSRKEARKTFFSRVRLLYGLDCEPDRISLLQAVLLMTYWYESPDDDKDTWYWMGVALTMAQVAGLHRNPESLRIPIEEKRLRRRLWWSCVMRDRLLALGIRRPARTLSNKFDVPILAFDDFDLSAPSEPLCRLLGESSLVLPENEGREVLAGMIVELSKLCVCLGHILRSQYTVMGSHPAGSEYLLKALVVPERSEHQALELAACDKELTDWLQSQDSRYKYSSVPSTLDPPVIHDSFGQVIHLHQALLHMIYLTAQSVLHRPHAVSSGPDTSFAGVSREVSRERITSAAISIAKLAFDMQASNQLRYLSTSSVPAFVSASLIHLLDIRSPSEEVRNMSIGRFYQCVQALQELQDMYSSANYGLRFLFTVLKNTDIRVPMFPSHLLSSIIDSFKIRDTPSRLQPSSTAQPLRFYDDTNSYGRMDMTYPSPSSSGNHIRDDRTERNEAVMQPDITNQQQATQSLLSPCGLFTSVGSHMVQPNDVLVMSPYLSTWTEIDSLVTGTLSFDANFNGLLSNFM